MTNEEEFKREVALKHRLPLYISPFLRDFASNVILSPPRADTSGGRRRISFPRESSEILRPDFIGTQNDRLVVTLSEAKGLSY